MILQRGPRRILWLWLQILLLGLVAAGSLLWMLSSSTTSESQHPAFLVRWPDNDVVQGPLDNFPDCSADCDDLRVLGDVLPMANSIHFVETSGAAILHPISTCSIESAARHHPDAQVNVIMTSPKVSLTSVKHLVDNYKNIQLKHGNIPTLLHGSPLLHLWESSAIQNSDYVVSHLSDVLRFAILYKFGGTYSDLDVMYLRSLPEVQQVPNFVVQEDPAMPHLAAGVIRFQLGHPITQSLATRLEHLFNGKAWGANGPLLLSAVVNKICHTNKAQDITPEKCLGIKGYPPNMFYAVTYKDWQSFFDPSKTTHVLNITKGSVGIHTWGKFSSALKLTDAHQSSAYYLLASANCPHTFARIWKVEFLGI